LLYPSINFNLQQYIISGKYLPLFPVSLLLSLIKAVIYKNQLGAVKHPLPFQLMAKSLKIGKKQKNAIEIEGKHAIASIV